MQFHRVSIILSFVMILASGSANNAHKSQAVVQPTIYVLVSNADKTTTLNPILGRVKANLNSAHLELGIVTNPSMKNLVLNLDLNVLKFDTATRLELVAHQPITLSESPILFAQLNWPIQDIRLEGEYTEFWPKEKVTEYTVNLITAMALYSIGRCDLATPYFDRISYMTTLSNYAYTEFYAGNCSIIEANYETAAKHFNNAAILADGGIPLETAVNLTWTTLHHQDNEVWDAPISAFDKAVKFISCINRCNANEWPDIISRRAQLYALAEHYDNAISDFTTAMNFKPDDTTLHLLRGKMYLAQYEWDSALADYNKAIELDPAYPDAYYERGVLYYSILQTGVELREEALTDFQQYLDLAPDGEKAADAGRYVEQIEKELAALNG